MKTVRKALIVTIIAQAAFSAYAQNAFQGDVKIGDAVKSGLRFSFKAETSNKFGEPQYIQNGQKISKNQINSKAPHCSLDFKSPWQNELNGALLMKDQEIMALSIEKSNSNISVFGFGSSNSNFKLSMAGVILDAKKAGYKKENVSTIELSPSLQANFECKGFKTEPTIAELKGVIGESFFEMKSYPGQSNPYLLINESYSMKSLLSQAAEKAEAAKKKAEEKAAADKEAALRAREEAIANLGPEAGVDLPISSLKKGNSVILGNNLETLIERSGYTGSIYQNGKNSGAVRVLDIYGNKVNPLDLEKPYCEVYASKMMVTPIAVQVKFAPGIYEITKAEYLKFIKTAHISVKFKEELAGSGVKEAVLMCKKISTVEELKSVLGEETRIFAESETEEESPSQDNGLSRETVEKEIHNNEEQESKSAIQQ